MQSMTGFGLAHAELPSSDKKSESKPSRPNSKPLQTASNQQTNLHGKYKAEVQVKSVNGRFLEYRFHMPRDLQHLEIKMRQMIQESAHRGTFDVTLNLSRPNTGSSTQIQSAMLSEFLKEYKSVAKKLKFKASAPSLAEVLSLQIPGMLDANQDASLPAELNETLLKAFEIAISENLKSRAQEGVSIQKELIELLKSLFDVVSKIEALAAQLPADLKDRFEQKLKKLEKQWNLPIQIDDHRLLQEVALLIDRSDIREELARLKMHMKEFEVLIKGQASGPIGKKLDFYIQELGREINTIGSKSTLVEQTKLVVTAKTLVEKLREQIQNVE